MTTGLIAGWGQWYSPSPAYRLQTDAFLRGNVAISDSPSDMIHDFAWGEGGIQQVWGLGVPLLRLPFEALGRALRQPAFPDRLVLLVALAAFYAAAVWIVLRPSGSGSFSAWLSDVAERPFRLAAFVLLAAFPPIATMCLGAFNVYEEAVFAGYLAATGVFLGMLAFARRPSWTSYLALCLSSGLLPLVRPTAGCYGVAAFGIISVIGARRWGWRRIVLGSSFFAASGGLVYASNLIRFGDGLEFGHQLNISGRDLTYMSRLGAPYDDEPLVSAALELAGSVFGVRRLNGFDGYADDVVTFQSPTLRWRHFYNRTFDATYLVIAAAIWFWAVRTWKRSTTLESFLRSPLGTGAVWMAVSSMMLSAFYLRFHAISSRYIMDFAPAFAGLIAASLLQWGAIRTNKARPVITRGALAAGAVWFAGQLYLGSLGLEPTPVLTQAEALSAMPALSGSPVTIPRDYGAPIARSPYRLTRGWRYDGATEPLVLAFVEDMQHLTLEVEPIENQRLTDADYEHIHARLGLEFLQRESMVPTERGRRLVFSLDASGKSGGIRLLSLAMAPSESVTESRSKFRLMRLSTGRDSRTLD